MALADGERGKKEQSERTESRGSHVNAHAGLEEEGNEPR